MVCQFGGICHNTDGSYFCQCPAGLTGQFCQIDIDNCIDADCGFGVCMDRINGYHCQCSDGWTGLYSVYIYLPFSSNSIIYLVTHLVIYPFVCHML